MGGIFGGLLFVVNWVGGLFLFVLVGRNAWRETENGRIFRVVLGGAILGLLVGLAFNLICFVEALSKPPDNACYSFEVVLILSCSVGIILGGCLYYIHRLLEETDEEGPTQE